MAVPKSRRTKSSRNRRRSHIKLTEKHLVVCSNCGAKKLSHTACSSCGFYRGRMVVEVKEEAKKEEKSSQKKDL